MWSPNMSTPLVKLLSHRGPVRAAAIDRQVSHLTSATAR
jgi:U3 small nucleolar RNA-associated protein 7